MNRPACEREAELLEALRQGQMENESCAELRAHARACGACRLAVLLQQDAAQLAAQAQLPAAAQLLRRAELRRREAALARMATISRVLRVVGVLYGLVVTVWLAHLANTQLAGMPIAGGLTHAAGMPAGATGGVSMGVTAEQSWLPAWNGTVSGTVNSRVLVYTIAGAVAMVVCIATGLWLAAKDDQAAI